MTSQLVLRHVGHGYPGRPVLEDVSLTVRPGEHVGVIGENGAGKSTLLRLIAGRERPDRGEVTVVADGGIGHLDQVLALPAGATVQDAADAALAGLRELERRIRAAEAGLGSAGEAGLAAYAALVTAFEARDGYRADARLDAALYGLGLGHVDRGRRIGSLSGGEQSRLALACVLAPSPELLLLDEPTNHLDDAAVGWLENRIRGHRGTVVAVTHDREFLDRTAQVIVEVDGDRRSVARYGGGWNGYLAQKAAARHRWEQRYAEWRAEVERQSALAESGAQRLSEGWRMSQRPEWGRHRRSVEGQLSGRVRNARERLRRLREDPVPPPPAPLRFTASIAVGSPAAVAGDSPGGDGAAAEPLVRLEGVAVDDRLAVDRLELEPGGRVLVTGPNGAGKTTLLRVLAGVQPVDRGTAELPRLIGYLPQEIPFGASRRTLLELFGEGLPGLPEEHAQALLALGLFREESFGTAECDLSVGQRRRLALARLVVRPADLLLLDEPTNHLSLALVEELEQALGSYRGALVVVSHDRRLRSRFRGRRLAMRSGRLLQPA
ncbi:ABC-F family ATP-binding cassette domain-containing protein [Streptomyces thermolineatus]|uniref:ABC-F family ATP-binding cassette domain-containing protein n=1 Tax=Streptomyces thermolineatus TaxID=44033 RepID=A0ABN3LB38_9ACTN